MGDGASRVSAMLARDRKDRPELSVGEGLHLNRAGYDLWKPVIAPYLR